MKRIILSLAVLATVASCAKDEITDVVAVNQAPEIGFMTLNDRVTKSANDTKSNYQVYTASDATEYASKWYIDEDLSDADAIISGNKYFWPIDGSELDFYAYAPATLTGTNSTATVTAPSAISIAYTVPTDAQEDFTIATPVADQTSTNNPVGLKFSHMLSKVTVIVKLTTALENAGYGLQETPDYTVKLGVKSTGATADVTAAPASAWKNDANTTAATYENKTSYMIMPQKSEGCTIQIIGLTLINTKTSANAITDANLAPYTITGIDMDGFDQNTHYVITVTVDGTSDKEDEGGNHEDLISPISISSNLANWTEETATIYAVNNETETDNLVSLTTTDAVSGEPLAYKLGSYITDAAGDAVTSGDDYNALTDYLTSFTAGADKTGSYSAAASTAITISQEVTTVVYSVNNKMYTVTTYATPESTTATFTAAAAATI